MYVYVVFTTWLKLNYIIKNGTNETIKSSKIFVTGVAQLVVASSLVLKGIGFDPG